MYRVRSLDLSDLGSHLDLKRKITLRKRARAAAEASCINATHCAIARRLARVIIKSATGHVSCSTPRSNAVCDERCSVQRAGHI